jgi:hypothetical protein
MQYHLICVNPFGKYGKGQMITDPNEVGTLLDDREHNFVRIAAPDAPDAPPEPPEAEKIDPALAEALARGQALTGKMATDKVALDKAGS